MKMLRFLSPSVRKATAVIEAHARPPKDWHILFQNLTFLGTETVKGGSWRAHTELGTDESGKRHFLDITILADQSGPTHGQVVFYNWLIRNPDEVFESIQHRVIPAWEKRQQRRFPENWRTELTLSSVCVPRFGDRERPWSITFKLASLAGKRIVVELNKGIAVDVLFERLGGFSNDMARKTDDAEYARRERASREKTRILQPHSESVEVAR